MIEEDQKFQAISFHLKMMPSLGLFPRAFPTGAALLTKLPACTWQRQTQEKPFQTRNEKGKDKQYDHLLTSSLMYWFRGTKGADATPVSLNDVHTPSTALHSHGMWQFRV